MFLTSSEEFSLVRSSPQSDAPYTKKFNFKVLYLCCCSLVMCLFLKKKAWTKNKQTKNDADFESNESEE